MISVHLKPVNFFTKNPALDVLASTQMLNKSVHVHIETNDYKDKRHCDLKPML